MQVGDVLANGYRLSRLVRLVYLGNDGAVFWAGSWDDPDNTRNFGIFRNQQLLVQKGVTSLGDATFTILNNWGGSGTFVVSDGGQRLNFGATLSDGRTGLFQITMPALPPRPVPAASAAVATAPAVPAPVAPAAAGPLTMYRVLVGLLTGIVAVSLAIMIGRKLWRRSSGR